MVCTMSSACDMAATAVSSAGGGGSLRRLDKAHTAGQGEKRKRADVFEMLFVFSFSSFERESVIYAEK